MTIKLSDQKVSRLLRMYLLGYPQLSIAVKLGINQGSVSHYVNEFSMEAEEEGLEAAAKEYGIMDIVKDLHSLGAEMKKSHLTVEDAKRGLKVAFVFEKCDIAPDQYKDVAATCIKMKEEGFLPAAMELHQIEESSGMSCKEILAQTSASLTKLEQMKKKLSTIQNQVNNTKQTLASLKQQRDDAEKCLHDYMQKAGVDYKRLEKVEQLATQMKKADITNEGIEEYLKRQNLLNKANISIEMLTQILDAAKVPTAADGGASFLEKLTEYGGLDTAITSLKQEKQVLTGQTKDLEEKAKLKGSIQADVTHLTAQKKELEGGNTALSNQQKALEVRINKLQIDENNLMANLYSLNTMIPEQQATTENLDLEINEKQQKVADLDKLGIKRDALVSEINTAEIRLEKEKGRLSILDGFLGFVQQVPLEGIQKLIDTLPGMLESAKQGEYSPEILRSFILKEVTGGTLKVWRCQTCGAKFYVDKPAGQLGYCCPSCHYSYDIHVVKDEVDILKAALAATGAKPVMQTGQAIKPLPPGIKIVPNTPVTPPGKVDSKG